MYKIINEIDGRTYPLHIQTNQDCRLINPRYTGTLNKTGSLTFQIPESHMYYGTLEKLRSSVQLYEDGELIYEGRVISDEADFYNVKSVVCEGSMAYLQDSLIRPFSLEGGISGFLQKAIELHNGQVEARKQFTPGQVTVTGEGSNKLREITNVIDTWSLLKEQLVDIYGGYLWVSYPDGKKVLNYTWDCGGYNQQKIRFGENLLDLTRYQDATSVVTCLVPYGATVEYKDDLGETQEKVIDITSVNDGQDYLMADQPLIDRYGKIWAAYTWPDITEPRTLKLTAEQFLRETAGIPDTLKVSAADLKYIGEDIRGFRLGLYTTAVSKPHNIQKDFLLTKLDIYLDDPGKGSISLGDDQKSLTAETNNRQVKISKALAEASNSTFKELDRKIENATTLITGGFGGYVILDNIDPQTGKKIHPWRILIMNTPDKATATNVIQINQNGIGFSTTGINGPYRNAWTIDGNLVADFVTTGTMLADRIRGGTLELGGTGLGKNGVILIKDKNDNVVGQIDINGVRFSGGTITGGTINGTNIYGGDNIPFSATRGQVRIGDFYVDDEYGRHIFQSTDEVTGMSAGVSDRTKVLLWAGWGLSTIRESFFLVRRNGDTEVNGRLLLNGRNILDIIASSGGGGGGCSDSCDDVCDNGCYGDCNVEEIIID